MKHGWKIYQISFDDFPNISALGSASYSHDHQCYQYEKAVPGSVELSALFPVKTIITGLTHDCRINYLCIYIYNDSSALVTSSSASIPPRIMVIQWWFNIHKILLPFRCRNNQQSTNISQHSRNTSLSFPPTCENVALPERRCALRFFCPLSPDISPSYPLVNVYITMENHQCYSWENSL